MMNSSAPYDEEMKVYVNGALCAQARNPNFSFQNDKYLGALPSLDKDFLHGSIDDVRFYERSLNEDKIRRLYEGYDRYSKWADIVFEDGYALPSLSAVETFIESNGHLPDVPSADEIVEDGRDVAKINAKLLQKIEKLTLYTIEQDRQLLQLEKRL